MINQKDKNLYFIRFPFSGKVDVVYSDRPLKIGDNVKAETEFGTDIAKVVSTFTASDNTSQYNKCSFPTEDELKKAENDRIREKELSEIIKKEIQSENLSMKVLAVHIMLTQTKLVIIFTANTRIDFRNLVKVLNEKISPLRVQMHQIAMRESMALFGGLGTCGRKLCCTLNCRNKTIPQVNRKMLKDQNFKQDEFKVIGACENLKCCLAHEEEFYQNELAFYPSVRSFVKCKDGLEKVKEINVIAQTITLENQEGGRRVVDAHYLETIQDNSKDGIRWMLVEDEEDESDE